MILISEMLLGKIRGRAGVWMDGWWPLANTVTYLRFNMCLSEVGIGGKLLYISEWEPW